MKVLAILIGLIFAETLSFSDISCDFDATKRSFCGWRREWFGTRRAGWKSGKMLRWFQIRDHNSENGTGKFAYFLSRSRPIGFRSRLRSVGTSPSGKSCFNFSVALGGSKLPFPDGNSILKLFMVRNGETVESHNPIWTKNQGVLDVADFEKVSLRMDEIPEFKPNAPVQFVFEAIRGASKKTVVAIDNVSLLPCIRTKSFPKHNNPSLDSNAEAKLKKKYVERELMKLMLPARRGRVATVKLQNFGVPAPLSNDGSSITPALQNEDVNEFDVRRPGKVRRPKFGKRRGRKGKKRRRGKSRRKSRKQRRLGARRRYKNRNRVRPLTFDYLEPSRYSEKPHSLSVVCDFIEYTRRMQSCLRNFFSKLQRRPKRCENQYNLLESCVKEFAISCVPSRDLNRTKIEEIVTGALRESFKVKQVFCEEDGAFVFPQFPMDKLPIQCGARYFIKLSECSNAFSSMFHTQHGNPQLCRAYYKANQCQRQATAEECNFDTETMLLYGLNLQYQITYNPFCLNLPFSSWWPDS